MNKNLNIFTNGIIKENPLLVLMIGLCSSLAVTTSVPNGLGMGGAMTFVLLMSEIRNERKTKVGKVVSDKMEKTIVVAVVDTESHPLYKKSVKKTVKFKAHDENNEAHVGDTVSIMETRPLSKDKRWRLVEILERAK